MFFGTGAALERKCVTRVARATHVTATRAFAAGARATGLASI